VQLTALAATEANENKYPTTLSVSMVLSDYSSIASATVNEKSFAGSQQTQLSEKRSICSRHNRNRRLFAGEIVFTEMLALKSVGSDFVLPEFQRRQVVCAEQNQGPVPLSPLFQLRIVEMSRHQIRQSVTRLHRSLRPTQIAPDQYVDFQWFSHS